MATTKKEIGYGASGSEVKELQTQLNKQGYNLSVDGIFGSKTQSAVKDYQQKNKLAVDGIVGKNTWGSLLGGANKATTTAPSNTNKTPTTQQNTSNKQTQGFQYKDYQKSDAVLQAEALLQQQLAAKPSGYEGTYQDSLKDTLDKILNREEFSYDVNGDALYQQYKDLYTQQGKMAMMDTMGQAAALTGGYGNSYASTAGNQAYQAHLQQLNEVVPELYQLAYQKYQDEGDALAQQYALFSDMDEREYGRYRDDVSDYYTELNRLTNEADKLYDREYSQWADKTNLDYGIFTDNRNYNYQVERDAVADQQYREQFEYQKDRDAIADSQWNKNFNEGVRQFNEQFAYQKDRDKVADSQWEKSYNLSASKSSSSGGSGGSGGSSGGGYDNGKVPASEIKKMQKALGIEADGKWGSSSKAAAGGLEADDAYDLWQAGELGGYTYTETQNMKNFRAGIRTQNEFYGRSSSEKTKYGTYKKYIEGKLDEWLAKGWLTENEVASLIMEYGL